MNDKLVPFDRRRRTPDLARVREFALTARRLQREREESGEIVDRILGTTSRDEWAHLVDEPAMRNSGVLDRLSREVQRRLDRDPQDALALSNLATAIAETLPADAYPAVVVAQIRAQAWKDRGQALACIARYDDALAALDQAEAKLAAFGTLAHDRAVVAFTRAMTLREMDRHDDAIALLTAAKAVFRDHGDARLHLLCGIVEGMVLSRLGHFRAAYDAWTDLLPVAVEQRDRRSEACLHNNLGHAAVELGANEEANVHLSTAMAIFTDLGLPLEVAKTELARGRMLVRSGNVASGIALLHETRATFLSRGLIEEAGLCGLDIVDAMLALEQFAEAEALARRIVEDFTAARLNARAITALGYLTEAIAVRRASGAVVEHVRRFIHALRKDPEREFVAAT
jgi:tetratricopeptide (TPR) repeat protein